MAGILKSLKRAFMGELLQKTAVPVDDGSVRLTMRVKRDKITRETYVVLGLVAAMNYKYAKLSFDEFQKFLEAVHAVQKTMHIPDALPPLDFRSAEQHHCGTHLPVPEAARYG